MGLDRQRPREGRRCRHQLPLPRLRSRNSGMGAGNAKAYLRIAKLAGRASLLYLVPRRPNTAPRVLARTGAEAIGD